MDSLNILYKAAIEVLRTGYNEAQVDCVMRGGIFSKVSDNSKLHSAVGIYFLVNALKTAPKAPDEFDIFEAEGMHLIERLQKLYPTKKEALLLLHTLEQSDAGDTDEIINGIYEKNIEYLMRIADEYTCPELQEKLQQSQQS